MIDDDNKPKDEFLPIARRGSQCLGLSFQDGELSPAVVGTTKEGQPLDPSADIVQLVPQEDSPAYEMRTLYRAPRPAHKGPAQVATRSYRQNFDRVFGGGAKRKGSLAN